MTTILIAMIGGFGLKLRFGVLGSGKGASGSGGASTAGQMMGFPFPVTKAS